MVWATVTSVGGWGMRSTEIYDPKTNTFSAGPKMAQDRFGVAAVKIDDGRILVIGGLDGFPLGFPLASTEVLDIDRMEFSPGPSLGTARIHSTAVKLADEQRVLVIGAPSHTCSATRLSLPTCC